MFALTEDIVRTYTTPQSFERGREIYRSGALHHAIRDGNILLADCEGTESYHLRVELDDGGIRSSVCTCPVGGVCANIWWPSCLPTFTNPANLSNARGWPSCSLVGK